MYTLFNQDHRDQPHTVIDPEFLMFRKKTLADVETVIEYYRYGTFFTWGTHPITKLIRTLGVPLHYELSRYSEVTAARAHGIANVMGLTTAMSPGRIFSGVFYYGCPEILIAFTGYGDPEEMTQNYRDLTPVRLLTCPISNLSYQPPMGQNIQSERGLVVVEIDMHMLMIMYRAFMMREYQLRSSVEGYALQDVTHFVGKYVIPNMLKSQTDIAIFNRMYNLFTGAPHGVAYRKVPVLTTDYTSRLDKALERQLEKLSHARRDYGYYLRNIPSIFSENPWVMPDMVETRQVWWALFIARVKQIEFLINLGGEEGLNANRHSINSLKIDLKEFRSDSVLKQRLPWDIWHDLDRLIQYWKTL